VKSARLLAADPRLNLSDPPELAFSVGLFVNLCVIAVQYFFSVGMFIIAQYISLLKN
jgi:hypothetical protein